MNSRDQMRGIYRVHINEPAHSLNRFKMSLVAILLVYLITMLSPLVAVQSTQFISTQHRDASTRARRLYIFVLLPVSEPPVSQHRRPCLVVQLHVASHVYM